MDKEKIVVILLLITIILSITSVVITLSASTGSAQPREVRNIEQSEGSGTAGFEIVSSGTSGGGT